MARILTVDNVPQALKNSLAKALRATDEAVLLPSADLDATSGKYENIVFRLDATEKDVPTTLFSPGWGSGVSAIKVSGPWVETILNNSDARKVAIAKMCSVINSETADPDVVVGPHVDGDENDRDKAEWTAGFDGPACFVGLYSAEHSCAPEASVKGRDRCHSTNYLIVKAGAGQAACQFHSRFMTALKKGSSLSEIFEDQTPGGLAASLRRVTRAGSRNRSRILMIASDALGAPIIDSVPDQSSCGRYRAAVTNIDVSVNVLRKVEDRNSGNVFQYSTGVDATASQGLLSMSNLADGVVLFLSESGDVRQNLRNEAHSSLPFSSPRLVSDRDLTATIVKEYKAAAKHKSDANIDHAFISDRFGWKNRKFSETDANIEPLALWGSHDKEQFFAKFARELGVSKCQVVRLRPMCVCVAGVEGGKLRAALRSMKL
tara:strand:- start:33 stop:1331 length:1299 start_codon:yes stop_codon:yes gene_type:complete